VEGGGGRRNESYVTGRPCVGGFLVGAPLKGRGSADPRRLGGENESGLK